MNSYAVYIIRTAENFLYVGITFSVEKRFKEHTQGTKSFIRNKTRPFTLVYIEYFPTKSEAARREKQIKGFRREKKEKLIEKYLSKGLP